MIHVSVLGSDNPEEPGASGGIPLGRTDAGVPCTELFGDWIEGLIGKDKIKAKLTMLPVRKTALKYDGFICSSDCTVTCFVAQVASNL